MLHEQFDLTETLNDPIQLADFLQRASHHQHTAGNKPSAAILICAANVLRRQRISLTEYEKYANPIDVIAVWEEIGIDRDSYENIPGEGALARREYVANTFTFFCLKWYRYTFEFLGFDNSFDWEFLPVFTSSLPTFNVNELTMAQIGVALGNVVDAQVAINNEGSSQQQ